jgi:hypothetical protein
LPEIGDRPRKHQRANRTGPPADDIIVIGKCAIR